MCLFFFFFRAEDGIRDRNVTGVQTCALPIFVETRFKSPFAFWRDFVEWRPKAFIKMLPLVSSCSCKIGRATCRERRSLSKADVKMKEVNGARESRNHVGG